jgi:hypothetical protein
MAIPTDQLASWSHQGGTTISSTAYNSIQRALTKTSSPVSGRGLDIYLQGSYANATNTYGDSDIDVVVCYGDTFYRDMDLLTQPERGAHERAFPPATYLWTDLKRDVLSALTAHFSTAAVSTGNKAIKVKTGSGRMTADVVPAVQFRRYARFVDAQNLSAHWGIHFFDSHGTAITNYPKYHIQRGQDKNRDERTRGRYKPTVRIFKNLRTYLIDNGKLTRETAPSYFIECALHNTRDSIFREPYSKSVPQILEHLWKTPCDGLLSQNGIVPLIGTGPTHWSADNYVTFLAAARDLWAHW